MMPEERVDEVVGIIQRHRQHSVLEEMVVDVVDSVPHLAGRREPFDTVDLAAFLPGFPQKIGLPSTFDGAI